MEKLNIAELLKDCPIGMELDCTMFKDVYFDCVEQENDIIKCYIQNNDYKISISFTKYGCYTGHEKSKCVIFPKGKTTWKGFQRPFKDGDVLAYQYPRYTNPSIYIHKYSQNLNTAFYVALSGDGTFFRVENKSIKALYGNDSSARFATEEEKQKLFDAIKANGYKWNPETKTLEKLIEPKFKIGDRIKHRLTGDVYKVMVVLSNGCGGGVYDVAVTNEIGKSINKSINIKEQDSYDLASNKFDITTLKPFESRVLVRTNNRKWVAAFYSHYDKDSPLHHCVVGGLWYEQCVPYNGNGHLLDTTNDCDDYYKTWE